MQNSIESPRAPRTSAVILTGSPGAGKTSVLEALTTRLEIDGVTFGALDSEQLGWGSPWLDHEPWLESLRAVIAIQRGAGRRLFLVAATTETGRELSAVRDAIAADHVLTVLLSAPPDVVAARVHEREPDDWPGKPRLVAHARDLAVSMDALPDVDVGLSTDARDAADVAWEIREAMRARRPAFP